MSTFASKAQRSGQALVSKRQTSSFTFTQRISDVDYYYLQTKKRVVKGARELLRI